MKTLIALLGFSLLACSSLYAQAQAQEEEVYYFVDTINVNPANRVVSIGMTGPPGGNRQRYYTVHCRCLTKNEYVYPMFYHPIDRRQPEVKLKDLPTGRYLSWKELENGLYKHQQNFDSFYALTIVEKLPDGMYIKNKVRLFIVKQVVTE
ncbi:hypothetical protein [Pedobacter deserti]|uniref:hypothetical protein n=1 Tax=Pedobacter deserti TaxID=2817382 RepID=UPI00210B95CC|nr:hypothetical protein [Pedobacter sp. SYSU D00382]